MRQHAAHILRAIVITIVALVAFENPRGATFTAAVAGLTYLAGIFYANWTAAPDQPEPTAANVDLEETIAKQDLTILRLVEERERIIDINHNLFVKAISRVNFINYN